MCVAVRETVGETSPVSCDVCVAVGETSPVSCDVVCVVVGETVMWCVWLWGKLSCDVVCVTLGETVL